MSNAYEFNELLVKRLYQLRMLQGVSAREMSLSIGQSQNYINQIENRNSLPSMSAFFYICEYLSVHPKDFFNNQLEDPTLYKLLTGKIKKLNAKEMQTVIQVMDTILELHL